MATLILGAAGAAIGGSIGGAILGVSAATIGGFIGSTIGSVVDSWFVSSLAPTRRIEGARLDSLRITSSTWRGRDPAPLRPDADRRQHHLGHRFPRGNEDHHAGRRQGRRGRQGQGTTRYPHYASFAVALCEGPITGIGRVWADGKPMDLRRLGWYPGDEAQAADPFIAAKMGAANTPAYRGTALCRFRGTAAVELRQPPAAALLRGVPTTRRPRHRRRADPRRHSVPASGEFTYATKPSANPRAARRRPKI